jgi:ubiquinone/menaquinone biosynthesis C-methylase UbiE
MVAVSYRTERNVMHDALVSTTRDIKVDLTRDAQYDELVNEEIEHYSAIEVTKELTEGGTHAQKAWAYYFEYLQRHLFHTSFHDEVVAHANSVSSPRLLSLGCGYGGQDLMIASRLSRPFEIIAIDLNSRLFAEAERRARSEDFNIQFVPADMNFISIQPGAFDVIYAHASLHHALNLEHLFDQIYCGLKDNGRLVVLDIIGKTQVLFWKENVEFAARLIRNLPFRYRPWVSKLFWRSVMFNPYSVIEPYSEPAIQVGMEGIRQEEIEPLLQQRFTPVKLFKYNAYMRLICTNPAIGPRLDPAQPRARAYLDKLIDLEMQQIENGNLRATELLGVFEKRVS